MRTQTLGNEYNLREVTTAYRTDIINEAAKDGKPFFIREVKINPELQTTSLLLKERLLENIYMYHQDFFILQIILNGLKKNTLKSCMN